MNRITNNNLNPVFLELRTQLETVIGVAHTVERFEDATATAIRITKSAAGTITLESFTASGFEPRFEITAGGDVTFYQVDGFAFRLLAAWALEIVANAPKAPCKFYGTIKTFYAVAKDVGLDTENDTAARRAINAFFGFAQDTSRAILTGYHWAKAATAVRSGELAW